MIQNPNLDPNITVTGGDILPMSQNDLDSVAMIAAILAIEAERPGSLAFVFRTMALLGDGWKLTATTSNPSKSLEAQHMLEKWLADFREQYSRRAEQKGGYSI